MVTNGNILSHAILKNIENKGLNAYRPKLFLLFRYS